MNKNTALATWTDFNVENSWDVEFFGPNETEGIPALSQIDTSLCEGAMIGRIKKRWFILWSHRHPEIGTVDELFELRKRDAIWDRRNRKGEAVLREYHELQERLPSQNYVREITRREAVVAIARCWLPPEFHKDLEVA